MEPTVELGELMARIRAAVDAQSQHPGAKPDEAVHRPVAPPVPESFSTPAPPATIHGVDVGKGDLELALAEAASMLPRARKKTEVSAAVPKMLRSLYRNQGGFNGILIEMTERLLVANQHLERQNAQFQERLDSLETTVARQHEWITAAGGTHDQSREWMLAIESFLAENAPTEAAYENQLRRRLEKRSESPVVTAPVENAASVEPADFQRLQTQLDAVGSHANRLGDHLNNLQAQVDEQAELSQDWHAHYRQATAHHELQAENSRRLEERQHNDASYFKNQLWFLQRLVESLPGKVGPPAPSADGVSERAAGEGTTPFVADHGLDALYLAFEEAMRGSRHEIKERTSIYLPYITAANAGTVDRPVLDLGCGRGEWLEVLRERGLAASGVDLNTCMIEVCRERGLPATFANALDHLRGLPDASCGAVTAFHLIEHLPIPVLVPFLRDCRRVLMPGGVAIFETPNPYNVLVGSGYFYHDFTHQRPLPPTSTKFLVEQMGFSRVEILPLNPWDESAKVHGEGAAALEWRFNELFYGPQDYALIATP